MEGVNDCSHLDILVFQIDGAARLADRLAILLQITLLARGDRKGYAMRGRMTVLVAPWVDRALHLYGRGATRGRGVDGEC